jgi:hypothetical protein
MSLRNSSSEFKKLRGLISLALRRGAEALVIRVIGQNRAQSTAVSGAVVAAAGAIVPTLTFTAVSSGKVRVTGFLSYAAPASSGTAHWAVQYHNGSSVVQVAVGAATTSGGAFSIETDGLPIGTATTWNFVTLSGDASITLGTGSTVDAAALIVQELQ